MSRHSWCSWPSSLVVLSPAVARADEHSIIRSPGDHPAYIFEAEPHVLVGFAGPFDNDGNFGVGFRGTVHIANGFVPSINDSVGVGFGFDVGTNGHVLVPVVMQWNFWLSTHWSVFGEPGFAFGSGDRGDVLVARVLRGRPVPLHRPDRAHDAPGLSGLLAGRVVSPVARGYLTTRITVPPVLLVQYTYAASTATPVGPLCPLAMATALPPPTATFISVPSPLFAQ